MANYNIMDKKYNKMFDTIDKVRAYFYKNKLCVFEYRGGMNGYSLIQTSPASILTDGITNHNYQLHYFNNNTFDIDVIVNVVQNFIGALEKHDKEDKVRNKKKDLEKDFEESN